MINSRFSINVHILTLLATSTEPQNSEWLAGSINVNAVVVRKELSVLRNAGLIHTWEGKNGGSVLARLPEKIRLDELYQVVYESASLFNTNKNKPNPKCPVGKKINSFMSQIDAEAQAALIKSLKKTSIRDLLQQV